MKGWDRSQWMVAVYGAVVAVPILILALAFFAPDLLDALFPMPVD